MSGVTSIVDSIGRNLFRLSYEISPVILVGGIAANIPGGMLPIVALTEAANFAAGLLSGGSAALDLDNFSAHWRPLPGGTLISNDLGEYPFANQTVAANAIISKPLVLSMLMECPVRGEGGYVVKLVTLMALKATLDQHTALGGTYTVATPAALLPNMLLLDVKDVTRSDQPQSAWQFDFRKPLLTLEDAAQAQNGLMSTLSNGTQTDGTMTGTSTTLAGGSGLTPYVVPSASNLAGASAPGDLSAGVADPAFSYAAPTVTPVTASPL